MGVEIDAVLTLDSSWKMMGWNQLERKLRKLFPEMAKDIQKKIALRDTELVARDMPIRQFHDQEAGLFTSAITGGFIKRRMIDANTSVVNVDKRGGTVNVDISMPLKDEFVEQFEDEEVRMGNLMKVAGGLDRQSATRLFDEAIKRSKQG